MIATVRCLFFHTQFLLRLLIHYTLIFCRLFLKGDILSITWYDLCSFIHKYWFRFRTTFIIISLERRNIARREAEGQAFVQSRFVYFLENQSSSLCPSSSCNRCIVFLWRLPFQEICAVEENNKPILIKKTKNNFSPHWYIILYALYCPHVRRIFFKFWMLV